MSEFILFDDKKYALDLNKCIEFMLSGKDTETSKSETYGLLEDSDKLQVISRELSETNSNCNDVISNIKYDLLKNILNMLLSPIFDSSGQPLMVKCFDHMHFGQMLAFNTLVNAGILVEIDEDNENKIEY